MSSCHSLHAAFVLLVATLAAPVQGQPARVALPAIKSVEFDRQIGFRVNGRPFFPILLYDAPTDEPTLAQLRESGFNVLTCRPEASDTLPAQGFYGAIHPKKNSTASLPGVLLAIGPDSPALYFKQDLLRQTAEANAKVAASAPGRPIMNAIGYWEDEPAGVFEGKLPSRAKYEDLAAAIDVSAPYLYPVPYQPVASVGEAVARARAATGGKKPLLPILQLYAWKADDRYPTPAELRCMAFLALVEGAHGIGYYSYSTVTRQPKTTIAAAQPELWKSVGQLNREIAGIGPRLVSGKKTDAIAVDVAPLDAASPGGESAVRFKAIEDKHGLLALLVNPTETPQQVRLVWRATDVDGTFTLAGGKQLEFKQGVAMLTLDPFGVEILRRLQAP